VTAGGGEPAEAGFNATARRGDVGAAWRPDDALKHALVTCAVLLTSGHGW
jgi:hypothetical protein